jgi:hypothetical protein
MRAALRLNRAVAFVLVFVAGVAAGQLTPPLWKTFLVATAETRYQEATYRCDRAMRDHLIAKQQVYRAPGKENVADLNAAEVALLDCQDYDMLRKRLIQWGLDENDLSLMALRAIEAKDRNLQQVIEIHEIRY